MAIRPLLTHPHPILRQRSQPVGMPDDQIRALLQDMADSLRFYRGVGLAACQIGQPLRLIVVRRGHEMVKLVDPVILGTGGAQECQESCLSFPGLIADTLRPQLVTLRALNEWGEPVTITGRDELAQCLCHEMDHLDGILLSDRARGL